MKLVWWQGLNENEVYFGQVLKVPAIGSAAETVSFVQKGKRTSEGQK